MNIYAFTDTDIRKKTGDRLKAIRLRQNITQSQLAFDAQVSLSSIKKIEAGDIGSFDSFIRVIRTLGILDILLPLVEDEQMSPNEYYEFVNSSKKKSRKRASKSSTNNIDRKDSEW